MQCDPAVNGTYASIPVRYDFCFSPTKWGWSIAFQHHCWHQSINRTFIEEWSALPITKLQFPQQVFFLVLGEPTQAVTLILLIAKRTPGLEQFLMQNGEITACKFLKRRSKPQKLLRSHFDHQRNHYSSFNASRTPTFYTLSRVRTPQISFGCLIRNQHFKNDHY